MVPLALALERHTCIVLPKTPVFSSEQNIHFHIKIQGYSYTGRMLHSMDTGGLLKHI
jgi:hypothetical protein